VSNVQYTQPLKTELEGADMLSTADRECIKDEHHICEVGISIGYMGMKFNDIQAPAEAKAKDSIADENGYTWRVKVLSYATGRLTLESIPVDKGDSGKKLDNISLLRVLVEHPGYIAPNGLHVGSTLTELKAVFPEELEAVVIPGYGKVQIGVAGSRILYMIDDTDGKLAKAADRRGRLPIKKLPAGATISMIVVMWA